MLSKIKKHVKPLANMANVLIDNEIKESKMSNIEKNYVRFDENKKLMLKLNHFYNDGDNIQEIYRSIRS